MTDKYMILHGDSLQELKKLDDNSLDSCVTDPPYGLSKEPKIEEVLTKWLAGEEYDHGHGGFMGKSWDSFVPHPDIWREVYRVIKPGGHALVFAGTRTQDLMTISLRLAGFEVRDVIEWLYATGFPKSHNTHNVFKRRYKCELENITVNLVETSSSLSGEVKGMDGLDTVPEVVLARVKGEELMNLVSNATKDFTLLRHIKFAKDEGIKELFAVLNVKQNGKEVLRAKIIRIGKEDDLKGTTDISLFTSEEVVTDLSIQSLLKNLSEGKYDPTKMSITLTELRMIIDLKILSFLQKANTLSSITDLNHTALKPAHEPIIVVRKPLIDADTGRKLTVADCVEKHGTGAININASRIGTTREVPRSHSRSKSNIGATGISEKRLPSELNPNIGRFPANCITLDSDEFYSKYFNITPQELSKKASKSDRNSDWKGEEIDLEEKVAGGLKGRADGSLGKQTFNRNTHPTVKPLDLMAWLVRLVTPPEGTVLDPFAGSGSTLVAAKREGFGFVGVELTDEYIPIIEARTGESVTEKAERIEEEALI